MLWWIVGVVVFVIVLLILIRMLNKKPDNVTRMPSGLEEKSKFQKFLDACCLHRS